MFNNNLRAAAALLVLFCMPNLASANGNKDADETPTAQVVYTETDVSKNDVNFFATYVYALNRDLDKDGVLFRVEGLFDKFIYNAADIGTQNIDGAQWEGAAYLGYQIIRDQIAYSGFVGVDVPSIKLSPNDPTNPVRGTQVGFKVKGEIETDLEKTWYLDIIADYSTAFQSYSSRIRPGWKFGSGKTEYQTIIGPEGGFAGDQTFDAQRLGLFVLFPVKVSEDITAQFIIAGGYQWVENRGASEASTAGDSGAYATMSFELPF